MADWRRVKKSDNVVDRRGGGAARVAGGGGLLALALLVAGYFFPEYAPVFEIINSLVGGPQPAATRSAPVDDEMSDFTRSALGSTETVWAELFNENAVPRARGAYQPPKLVLFSNQDRSACGPALAQTGPFYCPADRRIYIDPSFFRTMEVKLGAPGDFARAYVIAHEVAHHVQNLTGLLVAVNERRASVGRVEGNQLTVRIELQADCYAGVWTKRAERRYGILEEGDLEEALRAAFAVGDDVLMRMSGRRVDPTQFTHGSAEQRAKWFRIGVESGDPRSCDTFSQPYDRL